MFQIQLNLFEIRKWRKNKLPLIKEYYLLLGYEYEDSSYKKQLLLEQELYLLTASYSWQEHQFYKFALELGNKGMLNSSELLDLKETIYQYKAMSENAKNDYNMVTKQLEKISYRKKPDNNKLDIERAKQYPIDALLLRKGVEVRQGFSRCIFHEEKTASMKYYRDSNQVHCFGCNKHADAIGVYMKLFNLSFKESVLALTV